MASRVGRSADEIHVRERCRRRFRQIVGALLLILGAAVILAA